MAYSIKTFYEIHELIVQEIRNSTGLTVPFDSDASIRADGTASVVEGLYHHQAYIQKQLFIATADEPYLYIHAEELGLPSLLQLRHIRHQFWLLASSHCQMSQT